MARGVARQRVGIGALLGWWIGGLIKPPGLQAGDGDGVGAIADAEAVFLYLLVVMAIYNIYIIADGMSGACV